jgi:hypothetical protein
VAAGAVECESACGWWSRRITKEHRLFYRVKGNPSELEIAQCRFHFAPHKSLGGRCDRFVFRHRQSSIRSLPHSSSASCFTAGASGFLNLSQSRERPEGHSSLDHPIGALEQR